MMSSIHNFTARGGAEDLETYLETYLKTYSGRRFKLPSDSEYDAPTVSLITQSAHPLHLP
jgi:hypothetical protein